MLLTMITWVGAIVIANLILQWLNKPRSDKKWYD